MSVEIKGYRVFIASPGGLDKEREGFRDTLRDYNEIDAIQRGVLFCPVGWEETLGGVGRPQSIINEEVRSCDYFVMVLWDRWGSAPDKERQSKYTSGTEEEYHIAIECLEDERMSMRQVVVFFRSVDERMLSDPGEQLIKVIQFKKKLEEKKTLLFQTYDEVESFNKLIRRYLAQWVRDHEGGGPGKIAKTELPPEVFPFEEEGNVFKTENETKNIEEEDIDDEIKKAWRLADEGKLIEAETRFAELVVSGTDADAFNNYGIFLKRVGRLAQAEVMHKRALDIYARIGRSEGMANQYGNLGLIYKRRGELDKAEEMHLKSLEIEKKLGLMEEMAKDYSNLGLIYRIRGDLDKAEDMHKKSLEINKKLGRLEGMANQYGNLGLIYRTRGELDKAEEMHLKSLKIKEKLGLQEGIANSYGNLGVIYHMRGELDKAEEMHKKSLEIEKKIGRLEGISSSYGNLGLIYKRRGEMDKAEKMFRDGLNIDEKLDRLKGMAAKYGNLGLIYKRRGELDKAEEMHLKSLEIGKRLGWLEGLAGEYSNLGLIYEQRGDIRKAREYWEKAVELYKKIGMPHMVEKVEGWIEGINTD